MSKNSLVAGGLNLVSRRMIPSPERFKVTFGFICPTRWATVTQISENLVYVWFDEPDKYAESGLTMSLYDDKGRVAKCVIL
ncbi:MAG: hypothetical protein K6F52_06195 [Clostridia bacterium]|nr:hypothetical protein [Clostridia bacterium]